MHAGKVVKFSLNTIASVSTLKSSARSLNLTLIFTVVVFFWEEREFWNNHIFFDLDIEASVGIFLNALYDFS